MPRKHIDPNALTRGVEEMFWTTKPRKCFKALCHAVALAAFLGVVEQTQAQTVREQPKDERPRTKIILDTDIGDDVDDAFALALALQSSEIEIVGITTARGDTALRARMVRRMLAENGRAQIPVAEGIVTTSRAMFTQRRWAERGPDGPKLDGIEFLLNAIRKNPGQITLVAIGPLTN